MLEGIGRFEHARHGFCVVPLCKGKVEDRDFYAFVAIEPQNYPFFKENYQGDDYTSFKAYGIELLRGWGTEPSQDIIDHIHKKYSIEFDIEHNFVDRLVDLANKLPSIRTPIDQEPLEILTKTMSS